MKINSPQKIEEILEQILKNMATKDDLKQFATKDDLKNELAKYATKDDLKKGLDDLLSDVVEAVDKNKADKADLVALEKRVDKIEEEVAIMTR